MRTDTERLDWLTEHQESVIGIFFQRADVNYEFLGWTTSRRHDECPTPRTAIDAAMDEGSGDG